jgi:cytoskeletal protein CcmA (bactofilin family)
MYKPFLFFVLILALTINVNAAEYKAGDVIRVSSNDTIYTDLFTGARQLNVSGVIKGDIYAGCEQVTVEGKVLDDVHAGCRLLEIKGYVKDMVIGFAETITIDGQVDGDVLAFGKTVRVTPEARIKGNVFVGCGEFQFEGGHIGGNVTGGAGIVYLSGSVGGKVELEAGEISFGEEYQAHGGTILTLPKDISEYELSYVPDDLEVKIKPERKFFQSMFFFWFLVSLLISGFILLAIFKNFSRDYLAFARQKPGPGLGYGALVLFMTPVAIAILAILVLTIPVSLVLLAAYLVLLYISMLFSSLYVGDYVLSIFKKEDGSASMYLSMLAGVIIVVLLPKIPFVGWLFSLAIFSFGMGSFVLYVWQLKQNSNKTESA